MAARSVSSESAVARSFYEIETLQNNWSARELERQITSLLFERLAKSKDKHGLMRLATKGQEILHPADIFKNLFTPKALRLTAQGIDLSATRAAIQAEYPGVADFEREFPCLCFALATATKPT